MPIYEYRCGACGHTLDALQKLADDPLKDCPECEKPALKRLMSAPSFRLKGGGWYETDFKSDKDKRRNLAESAEKASGSSAGGTGGDATAVNGDKGGDKSGDKGDTKGGAKSGETKSDKGTETKKSNGAAAKTPAGSSGTAAA